MTLRDSFSDSSGNAGEPSPEEIAEFIHDAENGRKEAVKRFCQKYNGHADAADENGQTALNAAAEKNQVDVANVLLFAGANPNKPAKDGATPFLTWTASYLGGDQKGDYRLLESMLINHADINFQQVGSGMSCLMYDRVCSDEKLLDYLLKKGADPTLKDKDGKTARDHAREMSDRFDGDSSYHELKEIIDHNMLTLETAEKKWPRRPNPAKILSKEKLDTLKYSS